MAHSVCIRQTRQSVGILDEGAHSLATVATTCFSCSARDLSGRPNGRLDRTLDPAMVKRRVLARKMNSALGTFDDFVVPLFLSGVEERKTAAEIFHVSPHDARPSFDQSLAFDLWVEPFQIFSRLLNLVFNTKV